MQKILLGSLVAVGLIGGVLYAQAATTEIVLCPDYHSTNWYDPSCQPGNKDCSAGDKYTLNTRGSCPYNPGCGDQGTGNYPHYGCAQDGASYEWYPNADKTNVSTYAYVSWYMPWKGGGQNCSGTCGSNCYASKDPTHQAYYFQDIPNFRCEYNPWILGYANQYTEFGYHYFGTYDWSHNGNCYDIMELMDVNCESTWNYRIYYDGIKWVYN